ncbi:MAG: hypothetical protein KTR32_35425 [Granulosicoccus sp.]|nr:hypothetical protein [Granulosicoccus sp.]
MKKLQLALVASAIAVTGSSVNAATDGTLAGTSTGTSVVTIIKDNAVQITNVADLNMNTHATLAADMTLGDDVCVFSSTTNYDVTVTADTGDFVLAGATAGSLPFSLTWQQGTNPAVALGHNVTSPAMVGDNTSLNCGGGTNATFAATVLATDFNAAAPDAYSATISILVSPQ